MRVGGRLQAAGDCSSDKLITAMRDRMVHRGPDGGDTGAPRTAPAPSVTAASRSSISRTAASQPMLNERGTVSVIFNGEIYNHAEVRRELESPEQIHAGGPTTQTPRYCCTPTRNGVSPASTSSMACGASPSTTTASPGGPSSTSSATASASSRSISPAPAPANGYSRRRSARFWRIRRFRPRWTRRPSGTISPSSSRRRR